MTIAVITKVCDNRSGGNLAMGDVYMDPQATGGDYDDPRLPLAEVMGNPMLALYVQTPVFRTGEILILDGNDRDQFGRKPSKWDVTCETFATIEEAIVAAREAVASESQ
jgi:hypothetical protein